MQRSTIIKICSVMIFLIISLLCSNKVMACSCVWSGTFEKVAKNCELVIRARVIKYGPKLAHHKENLFESMLVKITEVIKGQYQERTLVLLGDPGHLCRVYIDSSIFKISHEYLFALPRVNENPQPISLCGEFYMSWDGGILRGNKLVNHEFQEYSISVKDLYNLLKANKIATKSRRKL